MVTMPAAIPVTKPVLEPIVAVVIPLLVQLPPVVGSLNVVVNPTHTLLAPVLAAGFALTVTGYVVKQPAGNV